jgi:hypothetical protein
MTLSLFCYHERCPCTKSLTFENLLLCSRSAARQAACEERLRLEYYTFALYATPYTSREFV